MSFHNLRRFQVPYLPAPKTLIADAGPDIPGGLGANKGYWMKQLRNPHTGQWVKMGHLIEFHIKLKDGSIVKEWGTFEGSDGTNARVRVEGGKHLPDGYYHPAANNVNPRAEAQLGEDYLKEKGLDVKETIDPKYAKYAQTLDELDPEKGLKEKQQSKPGEKSKLVSGDAALANIRAEAAKQAKAEGRFPIMRDGKDAERAAEAQYKSIFEAFKKQHPEFNEHFANADEYWSYVKSHAAGTTTNWADDHTDIDPIMRASNQTYAQEILGVEPDGMIEFYRNAINHKNSQELSAAGYISLDRRMAWDYNSYKGSDNPNDGRYIVRVKPDEVTGALGYSGAPDEFGVVVGPDITSIPGRVTRVGGLEIQNVTPYIDDSKTFDRSGGGSPFRHFSTASQFNFYTTKDEVLPGESWKDFYAANNLETGAIPTKYDELYGAGSYDKMKEEFGTPQYSEFKNFFVKTDDGWGLDPRKLDAVRYASGDKNSDKKYDHYLKLLSTVQEIKGEPFMVSNAHSLDDPRLDPTPDTPKTTVYSSIFDNMPEFKDSSFYTNIDDVEDLSEEQFNILRWFTDGGYDVALKKSQGKEITPKEQQGLDELTKLIETHKTHADTVLWRGVPITDKAYSDAVDNYKPGMIVTSATYNSHSEDASRAQFYADMELGGKDRPTLQRVIFRTQVPKGTPSYRIPDEASSYGNAEQEVVFHPDSRYEILNVGETVDGTRVVDMRILPAEENKPKPVPKPSPAAMAKVTKPAAPTKPVSQHPSETLAKPEQKTVTAMDGNSQPFKKGDEVTFYLERDGKAFEVKGEYLGVSLGTLSGGTDANKPIIRIKGQNGIKDGDYPIRSDVINLAPGDSNFRDTRTPLASKLEAEQRIPDATNLTQLNKEEYDAIFAYTTENAFDDIRILMEKHPGKTLSEIEKVAKDKGDQETIQQLKLIEDAIYKSPLKEDTKLYRGIEILDDADLETVLSSLKVGEPIYDASIVSTSTDPAVAEKFTGGQGIIFEIDAPAGTPALETAWFYNDLSVLEDEYMLPRNTEFIVKEIGKPENGIVRVKVEYAPPVTREARAVPTAQITKPKYQPVSHSQNMTPEGQKYLDGLGTLPSEGQLSTLREQTLQLFTPDKNYKPFDPDIGMTKEQEAQLNNLTPLGEAVYRYIDSSSVLNKSLRNRDATKENSKQVKAIDEAMLISEHLPPGATVYRMMHRERFNKLSPQPGQVLFDRGFMSTTTSEKYVEQQLKKDEIAMRIVMPNNTSGLDLSSISWFKNEDEYLLPRKTGLRYLGIDSNGFYVFERVT